MNGLVYKSAVIDILNGGAELLRHTLEKVDIIGAEREKYEWGLGLIEACIYDIKELPIAQSEQQHGIVFKEIVVEYPSYNTYPEYEGKPYFSIKYTENEKEFIGYGTYKPEVLSEYLKEYFLPSAQPEQSIPLSWIEEYIERLCNARGIYSELRVNIINTMIDEWSEEQKGGVKHGATD